MSEEFFSEDGCDRWIAESGLLPENGIWVDCGASHPWKYSQTAFLRYRGWKGLAIDANPDYAIEWDGIENAIFTQAVLSDKSWVNFLNEKTNCLVSRIHEDGIGVPAFKLRQVLDSFGFKKIDFLSIDIESSETEVLNDFFRDSHSEDYPDIVVAEFNSCHKGRDATLFNTVMSWGYELVHITDSNAVFRYLL